VDRRQQNIVEDLVMICFLRIQNCKWSRNVCYPCLAIRVSRGAPAAATLDMSASRWMVVIPTVNVRFLLKKDRLHNSITSRHTQTQLQIGLPPNMGVVKSTKTRRIVECP
jgi:hypothetical protein